MISEFEKLKKRLDRLDFEVHLELEGIVNDLNRGRASEAIRRLAKVIENTLKKKVKNENSFKGKPELHNLLSFAHKQEWISKRQFENAIALKEVRNKESHELLVQEQSVNVGICIYSGIDILYSI